jgi:hypothetical protein
LLHDVAGYSWKKSTATVSLLNLRKEWTTKKKRIYEQNELPTISSAVLGFYDVDWFEAYEMYQTHGGADADNRPPWALVFDKGFKPATLGYFDAGYDKDDQRITIPIWAEKRRLYGLLGRACRQGEFKYVPYNNLNYTDHVYNLHATKFGAPVVLVEGAFDVWTLWQWKIPLTAIATMTSHISDVQIAQILDKHQDISIFYDNDPAGWKGSANAARRLTQRGGKVDIISTPKGVKDIKDMDHASFMKEYRRRKHYPCVIGDADNPINKATVPSHRGFQLKAR